MPTRDQLDVLAAKPELDAGSVRMMLAFDDVSSCRAKGMSDGRIPWDAVLRWAVHHGMDFRQTNRLWRVIRLIDAKLRERGGSR